MALLTEFLLRLSFGMAAGMAIVPPRLVTSGYYRNHLYVTLGLSALAALLSRVAAPAAFWWAVATAVLSYVGSGCWLYEKRRGGGGLLVAVNHPLVFLVLLVLFILLLIWLLPKLWRGIKRVFSALGRLFGASPVEPPPQPPQPPPGPPRLERPKGGD